MEELPFALLYVFLISTMLSIGLDVSGGELLAALKSRSLITRAFVANLLIIPLLGLVITKVIALDRATAAAILLVAAAPGGLRALQFTDKIKNNIFFAAGLMLLLTLTGIVLTPLLVQLMLSFDTPYTLPYGRIALFLLLLLFLPLLIGHLLRRRAAGIAKALGKPVVLISNLSFVATIVLTLSLNQEATKAIGTRGVIAMLLLIIGGMVVGWLLGGPDKGARRVMAVNTSMRNVALCLLIATHAFTSPEVHVAVLAFGALMVPPNMIFTLFHGLKERRAAKALAAG